MTEPCCAEHATLDICTVCDCAIATDETRYYGEREVCRQTMWSPAKYECRGPYCADCWTTIQEQTDRIRDRVLDWLIEDAKVEVIG